MKLKTNNKIDLKKEIFTIPNMFTYFRICLIPLIVWLYLVKNNSVWTGYILIVSGLTDIIDGFIARKFNMISNLGKIIDPIADKLTQVTMLICLLSRFSLMIIPFIFIVIKELCDSITGFLVIKKKEKVIGAKWHGKVATCLLYGIMIIHVFWINIPHTISVISITVCTIMIIISFILYSIQNIKSLKM